MDIIRKYSKLNKKQGYGLIGITTFIIISYAWKILSKKIKKLPNGPVGLPIIGNLLILLNQQKLLLKIAPKYGCITRLNVGPISLIYLNNTDAITAIVRKSETLYRPVFMNKNQAELLGQSLFLLNGNKWKYRRQIVQNALFNVTNTAFIDKIFDKMLHGSVIPSVNDAINNNKLWYPREYLFHLAFNTIYAASFGDTIAFNDESYKKYQHYAELMTELSFQIIIASSLPKIFKKIPYIAHVYDTMYGYVNDTYKIIETWINKAFKFDEEIWIKNGENNKYFEVIKQIPYKHDATFIEKMIYYYHQESDFHLSQKGLKIFIYIFVFTVANIKLRKQRTSQICILNSKLH